MTLRQPGDDLVMGFVNHLVAEGLADRTIKVYDHAVERWLIWCGTQGLDPLLATATDLRTYSELLPDTHASRRQHACALAHWSRFAGITDQTKAIRKPTRRRMKWNGIESDQAAAVIQASRGNYPEGTAALFMLCMGLRREETAAVDWSRFTPDLAWYEVHGKGGIIADLPVQEIVRNEISGRQSAFRYLFPGQRTAHVAAGTVSMWIGQVGDAAGVPGLTPHKLRHTYISDINDQKGLRTAQEMARHASPLTTAGYTRVTKEQMENAAASLSYVPVRGVAVGE